VFFSFSMYYFKLFSSYVNPRNSFFFLIIILFGFFCDCDTTDSIRHNMLKTGMHSSITESQNHRITE